MMRGITTIGFALACGLALGGCAGVFPVPAPSGGVIIVGDEDGERPRGRGKAKGRRGPRAIKVPPGHYPPSGHCRLWIPGRPPGHQPEPVPCGRLRGRTLDSGIFILFSERAWEADYDWREHERREPGSVPEIILELTSRGGGR